ncbi:MAG: hypothetical protein A2271_04035 [Candidatus Moranbacteria bacterium RIFOXYA12_FULL_35_19]|nr:MAG: hypothetical protein UR78_C0013G0009 [Candidatus Moranbacteria bacterium GW2011_GWF2_35_39]OGI30321.1 MAG: hypothetical protein A2343_00215 [Candidatus Moranbacteria bacterium RIFOXYB12_FULL_35_8]OGI32221.1 MAG: hypothetical protein A2489_00475 [Candidatus Moranbacteria bacterium RIFOXYC12_FULL_36_13]OGI35022.1 MAG: hypothetical protein A2271_04035 [Candidatus Moranbacteria bacterium RIFOXYA12_FULL_35_19]
MEIKLNLIPLEKKEEIAKKNLVSAIIKIEIFLTMVLAVFVIFLLSFNYILSLNFNSVVRTEQKDSNDGKYDKLKEYDENFKKINQKISDVALIKKSQLYWSRFFLKLNGLVFPGIAINSITTLDYSISLQGTSDTRDNLILLKEKLAKEECFLDINLPLDNLVDKNNISFKIDFNLDRNCLKNQ